MRISRLLNYFWGLVFLTCLSVLLASIPAYLESDFGFSGQVAVDAPAWMLTLVRILSPLASFSCAALSFGLAVLLYIRKRDDRMALFISFYLLMYAVVMGGPVEIIPSYWGVLEGLAIILQTSLLVVPTVILFSTFPDGRFVPSWTRWLVAVSILLNGMIFLRPLETLYTFSDLSSQLLGVGLLFVLGASLFALAYRYRYVSGYHERQQAKWVVAGLILWIIYIALSSIPWTYTQNLPPGQPLPWWFPMANLLWWVSLSIFPVSLSVAILRSRLWDIDLLIRRTLTYGLLTSILALVYFGGVVLLQGLFSALTGHGDSPLITVISTLVIAALFNPLRIRIQEFLDRRFYRKKYDAERTLARFSVAARDEVDLDNLAEAMLEAVDETLQPEKSSLWLKAGIEDGKRSAFFKS